VEGHEVGLGPGEGVGEPQGQDGGRPGAGERRIGCTVRPGELGALRALQPRIRAKGRAGRSVSRGQIGPSRIARDLVQGLRLFLPLSLVCRAGANPLSPGPAERRRSPPAGAPPGTSRGWRGINPRWPPDPAHGCGADATTTAVAVASDRSTRIRGGATPLLFHAARRP